MKFTLLHRIPSPESTLALALSRDGTRLGASGFDQKLRVYDTATMTVLKTLHLGTSFPHPLCFSPDGRVVASGGKALVMIDTTSWKKTLSLKGHRHEIQEATFSPDGARVYTVSGNNYTPSDWTARAWDAATGAPGWKWKSPTMAFTVAASPDGRSVAVGNSGGEVTLLDAATGLPRWSTATGAWLYGMRFTPDGATVLATGDGPQLNVLSVADGALRVIPLPSAARSFALMPDPTTVVIGGTQYGAPTEIVAVDLVSGKVCATGPKVGRLPQGVELSPDGKRLYVLVGDPDELLVFEIDS